MQQSGSLSSGCLPVCLDQQSLSSVSCRCLLLHLNGGWCKLLHVYDNDSTWQERMMQLKLHQVHLIWVVPDRC